MKTARKNNTAPGLDEIKVQPKLRRASSKSGSKTNGKHPLVSYEQIPIGIVECSLEGKYINTNEEFCRLTGYARQELLQLGIRDITHEDDAMFDIYLHERLVAGKIPFYKIEKRIKRKDGGDVWVELTRSILRDVDGKALYTIGSVLDISDRKHVERVLRESAERLRLATESAQMFMWEWDFQKQVYTVADSFAHVIGFSADILPQGSFDNLLALSLPEDVQTFTEAVQRAVEGRSDIRAVRYRVRNPGNGQIVWLEMNGKVVYDEQGNPVRMFGVAQNITESKRTQDEIAVISRVPAENPDPVMRLTPQGRILYANSASKSMLADWFTGTGCIESDALQKTITEAYTSGKRIEVEIEHRGRFLSCTLAPILEAGYVNFYGKDITERKEAEIALRRSESNLWNFLENATVGIHWVDRNGIIIWVNQAELDMLGYSKEEYVGRHINDFHVDEGTIRDILRRLSQGETLDNYEARLRHKDGSIRYGVINSNVLWEDGEFIHTRCFTRDITARKQAEEKLRESEERFRALVSQATAGIAESDMNSRFTFVNPRFCEMLGYTEEELLGKTVWELTYSEDLEENRSLFKRMLVEGKSYQFEKRFIRRDGTLLWTNVSVTSIQDTQGKPKGGVGVIIDVEERKQAEQALTEFARQQEALYKLSDQLHRTESLTDVFDAALEAILNALQCDRASILLLDETDAMRFVAWRGLSDEYRRVTDGHSPWKPDEQNPEPVVMDDIRTASLTGSLREVVQREGIRSLAFIPLVSNGKLIGKFMVYFDQPHKLEEGELDLSVAIAHQLAFAIDHKRAEDALRQNEQMFSTLIDTAPFGVYFIDSEFRLRAINEGSEAVFRGIHPLIGRDFAEILRIVWQEPFATEAIEQFRHTLRTGESFISPPIVQERANIDEIEAYDWQIHRITMADGTFGVVCYFYDLSEQKQMEAAVRASESLYRAIARNIPGGGVYVVDKDFRYIIAEGPVTEAFGLKREMLEGRTVSEAFPDERARSMEERLQRTFAGETVSFETQHNGRVYWTRQAPLLDSIGQAIILTLDITERKQVEQALHESEEHFSAILRQATAGIVRKDAGGRLVFVNQAFCNMLGYTEAELLGKTIWDFMHEDDIEENKASFDRLMKQGIPFKLERRLLREDGSIIWVDASVSPIMDADGKPQSAVAAEVDITARKQAEEAVAADLNDTQILRDLGARLVSETDIQVMYHELVLAALQLTHADAGTVQLLDENTGELILLATQGLTREMEEHFHRVKAGSNTSCGLAVTRRQRTFVDFDVPASQDPDGSRRLHAEAGLLSGQSTPLITRSGKLIGMISTHWREHRQPTERELRYLDLLARQATDLIERKQAEEALQQLNLQLEDRVLSRTERLRAVNQTLREEIAERKRVEEALRNSEAAARENEEKLSTLFELLPVGISFLDLEGQIIQMNSALANIMKLSRSGLMDEGHTSRKYIRANGTVMPTAEYASTRALTEGKTIYNVETGIVVDNEIVWTSVSAAPVAVAEVGAAVVTVDITESKRAERALQESRERLQILSQRLVEVQEEERRAIARELHDRVGQTLAALNINLLIISSQLAGKAEEQVAARLGDSMKLVAETITLVRDVMSNLRPSVLDDYGLEAALQSHVNEYMSRYEIKVVLQKPELAIPRLGPSVEMTFLRIAQEALMNTARHSRATQVQLSLWREGSDICMAVEDNGTGISSWQDANRPGSHGLTIMRERAEAFGGSLQVSSVPGKGTKVEVKIPVETSTQEQKEARP